MDARSDFVERLVGFDLVDERRLPDAGEVLHIESLDASLIVGGPAWCGGFTRRLFRFETANIAFESVQSNLLDVVAPVVAQRGLELVHDFDPGPAPDLAGDVWSRVWINGQAVTFPSPHWVECLRPLELVNSLMSRSGIEEQFYFAGRQWVPSGSWPGLSGQQLHLGEVTLALLTDEMFEFLASAPEIEDLARPIRMTDVVGAADSWESG